MDPMFFSTLARRLVKEHGGQQKQFCKEHGIGVTSLNQWINTPKGRDYPFVPSEKDVSKLAELSGIDQEYLLMMRYIVLAAQKNLDLAKIIKSGAESYLSDEEKHVLDQMREGKYVNAAQLLLDKARKIA